MKKIQFENSYKLDYCYKENRITGSILSKEIKPLISTVFEGKDANVIAHRARNCRKTHLIHGNDRELGLTVLTMSEILSMAEERGDSVSVSVYEVSQETVYDLLDQEKRVVAVLEGAQGKIQLKGLPQVPVKSLSEFHKGVMIHATTGNANPGSLGRMNFLDMAGYEDSRKQNSALAPLEIARVNKLIYALQNVMYALNGNESHVPYRESKLTRMLKDCLKGCNRRC
ncbi:kinesin-like protein KIN-10C isoform X1 [Arabidopsis lyrata subsp. lyrata]|uniref:kinesin-like protein KIN-10C isoform X1 n=1 Tax=Arabidopsis lyrata subsp. lyrata TaxID=81972 RepID=UPI000A29A43D|nr:kinesin-like protein KIN-10C isoform X1 [Arabidopsis lyrata subsp. lyrata]|eukprot:XP_020872283.1 kinesin-like protein KIN-10C isoform X1 [Arabidopsis lyrata subsp. lyrata]